MKNRHIIILAFVIFSIVGCNFSPEKQQLIKVSAYINSMKTQFGIDYLKPDLLSHFPNEIKDTTNFRMVSSPPTCPPSFECRKQFGEIYLITKRDTTTEKWIKDNYLFKTEYLSDSNIIINLPELKFNRFSIKKCNKEFDSKYPIPYFESYYFNFGEKSFKKEIDGEIYVDYIHTIPKDLMVYVVKAEAGNFWKEDCQEIRQGSLNKWKNGYSKGIAVSENKDLVVYWTMIW